MSKPVNERADIQILCQDCLEEQYEPLDLEKTYYVIAPSFLSKGGDGFSLFPEFGQDLVTGPLDVDVFEKYVGKMSPIDIGIEGRIVFV